MKWKKQGLIITPGKFDWMVTHVQNPFPEYLEGDTFRIHFAGRDKFNRSRGGYATIDINKPKEMLEITKEPVIDLGDRGLFDDCGAMPSCIVDYNGMKFMYYLGWTQAVKVPFFFFIGLAISKDGGKTYQKYSKAPVFGRGKYDPYLTAMPSIIIENGLWRMWYVSCTGWAKHIEGKDNMKNEHFYHIKYAESKDGINWKSDGIVCIDYNGDEYAIARPAVYKEDGIYKMWYCHRGGERTYRAGYAESSDGITWNRKDNEVGIDVSNDPKEWDSYMICYPWVFKHKGITYMLYNGGRNYGENGTGLAILEE